MKDPSFSLMGDSVWKVLHITAMEDSAAKRTIKRKAKL